MSDKNLRFLLFGEDKTAGKAFSKSAEDASSATGRIGATFSKMGNTIGGEVGDLVSKVGEGFSQMSESGVKAGAKLMGVGGVIGGIGIAAQTMASADIESMNQLNAAVEATGKGYDGFGEDVEKAIKTQVKFGNTDADTTAALRAMTQAFGDPAIAMANMSVATDLAAAKHISLADAATMVGKIHSGSIKPLKEFGIVVKTNADGTKDYDGAIAELSTKLSGQASASMDSFSGKVREGRAWLDNLGTSVATKVGPALTAAGPLLMGVGAIIQSNMIPALAKLVGGWVTSGTAATVGGAESLAASTEVKGGWISSAVTATASGIKMAAAWVVGLGPIAWIIAAVVALGAVFVVMYNKVGWFRDGVNAAWGGIKVAFAAVKDWLIGAWNDTLGFLKGIPDKIGDAFKTVASVLTWPFRTAFNTIADLWNSTLGKLSLDLPSWLGGGHFSLPSIPKIPGFADGGTVAKGGMAIVGERGPEMVSLPTGATVYPHNTNPSGGYTFNIYEAVNPHATALQVVRMQAALGV